MDHPNGQIKSLPLATEFRDDFVELLLVDVDTDGGDDGGDVIGRGRSVATQNGQKVCSHVTHAEKWEKLELISEQRAKLSFYGFLQILSRAKPSGVNFLEFTRASIHQLPNPVLLFTPDLDGVMDLD